MGESKRAVDPLRLANLSLVIGSALLIFISSILLVTSISFGLGYSISGIEIYLAIFITVLFVAWGARQYFTDSALKHFVAVLLFLAILFWIFLFVSGKFYDSSYDGQAYHQEAIIQLANGWNPFYEDVAPEIHSEYQWINSVSKGSWVTAAALYRITGSIEQSKAFNFLLIFASLFISFSAALCFNKITIKTAAILSILLSFNPVSIYQSLSFYVDGQLSSLLISLASLAYLLFSRWDKVIMLVTALNIIMALNVKFTGVVYASIFILGLLSYLFLYGKAQSVSRVLILSVISILVGICFIGYSPYIRNTLRHGHPFYPLLGSRSVDVVTSNVPGNFLGKNRFERLFLSIFSKSENVLQPAVSTLKWPFTVSRSELNTFGFPDTRVGGWGPLFGGAIIISMVILLIALGIDLPKTKIAAGASLLIMISMIVNWESWWARFSPQLWMTPIIFILLSEYLRSKFIHFLGTFMIIVLIINVLLVSGSYLKKQYHINQELKQQLISIKIQQEPVFVYFDDFRSNRVRLEELGIKYSEMKELKCSEYITLISSNTKVCVKKPS